jgi:hypothetical protein
VESWCVEEEPPPASCPPVHPTLGSETYERSELVAAGWASAACRNSHDSPLAGAFRCVIKQTMPTPTDDDFARARHRMATIDRNWDEISTSAQNKLRDVADFHYVALFPQDICRFAAVLFLHTDQALTEAKSNGIEALASACIQDAIKEFRAGQCQRCEVSIELDSYENVDRNFEGSYFNRLR